MKAFFNKTVLRKDITRFAPLWGLYTVFMLLSLLLTWSFDTTSAMFANSAQGFFNIMGVINLGYAFLCGLLLFGDLNKTRMCNMLHAMPLRREGWFLTHTVSGMLFCLVPNLLGTGIAALMLGSYAYLALMWLAMTVMQFLFFFGLTAFCAQCAGNPLGTTAVYLIVNFLAAFFTFIMETLYEPLLYGVIIDGVSVRELFCPVVAFSTDYLVTDYDNQTATTLIREIPAQPWIYTGVAAGVGILLLVVAVVLYRKRHLECAGDMIAWRPVAPVFLIVYTLVLGTIHYLIASFSGPLAYFILFVGIFIGFFTGFMMLEKQVHVFRGKHFLGFGILATALTISLIVTAADPIGITRRVPEVSQVEQVILAPYEIRYSYDRTCVLTDPEDIAAVVEMHKDACVNPADYSEPTRSVCLKYKLKNGTTLYREYDIPEHLGYFPLLDSFYSRPQYVLGTSDLDQLMDTMLSLEFYAYNEGEGVLPYIYIGREADDYHLDSKTYYGEALVEQYTDDFRDHKVATELMNAIYADCQAGLLEQEYYDNDAVGHMEISYLADGYYHYIDITLWDVSENTVAYMKDLAETIKAQETAIPK